MTDRSAPLFETLIVDIGGPVAVVTLNRPEVHNAFNAVMISELSDAFHRLASMDEVRVVVLRGNGPSFSAGADVEWMRASLDATETENIEDARRMSDMFHAIDTVPQPVIGRIHGAALGGGMGLMAVCDVVIAEQGTVFGFTEVKLGIIPAVISRFVIPKVGESWARALFTSGERFGAELALRIGLAHIIVTPDELEGAVAERVRELLSAGPHATRAAKRLVSQVAGLDARETRDFTAERIARIRTSAEGQEGLRAFLEKRRPAWRERG